jgi:hypothetical protein
MGAERLPMQRVRDVLRLKNEGPSDRRIARACGMGVGTASEYVERARRAGVSWPLPSELDDRARSRRGCSRWRRSAGRGCPPTIGRSSRGSRAAGWRYTCCGRSTGWSTERAGTATASAASCIGGGRASFGRRCGRCTGRARSSLWTSRASGRRSWTAGRASWSRSSLSWGSSRRPPPQLEPRGPLEPSPLLPGREHSHLVRGRQLRVADTAAKALSPVRAGAMLSAAEGASIVW